jgi:hypothetical protein
MQMSAANKSSPTTNVVLKPPSIASTLNWPKSGRTTRISGLNAYARVETVAICAVVSVEKLLLLAFATAAVVVQCVLFGMYLRRGNCLPCTAIAVKAESSRFLVMGQPVANTTPSRAVTCSAHQSILQESKHVTRM